MHISLAAEPIFKISGFPITNALINTWIAVAFLIAVSLGFSRLRTRKIPTGLQNLLEFIVENFFKIIDQVTRNRRKSEKFLPLVAAIFIFILLLNWMGQLPGTGSIGLVEQKEGVRTIIPFLRPATSDLNTTLALAVFAVIATHIFGIVTLGFFRHFNKYIYLGGLWQALKTLNPIKILTALITAFVGIIEIFSEIAKMISLSLRLFGNVFAGEVLLTVMVSLVAYIVPIPFMFLELLVGAVQATIFSMLTLVFLEVSTKTEH